MAILSNINGKFRVDSAGAVYFGTSAGAAGANGQILKSVGTGGSPVWISQSDIVGDYLPLAGGILTGATSTASGISFTVGGTLIVAGNTDDSAEFLTIDDADDTVGSQRPHIKFTGEGSQLGKISARDNGLGMLFFNSSDEVTLRISDAGNSTFEGRVEIDAIPSVSGDTRAVLIIEEDQTASAGRGGGLAFSRQNNIYGGIKTVQNTSSNDNATMTFQTIGGGTLADRLTIDEAGNVGIGTDSPGKLLDIKEVYADDTSAVENLQLLIRGSQNDLNPVGDSCGLGFGYSGASNYIKTGIINEFTNSNGTSSLHLCTSAATAAYTITKADARLTILAAGNVGIGTDLPDAKLHIYGSTSLSEMYLGEDADTDKAGILKYTQGDGNGTGFITLSHYGNTSVTQSLAIKYGGKVGIGTTSPNARLEVDAPSTTAPSLTIGAVAGQIFKNEDSELAFGLDNAAPYNVWMQSRFNGNVSRPLLINPLGGNVGIRTNSPNAPLDVTSKTSGSSGIQQWSYNSSPSSYRLQLNTIVSSGLVKFSFDQLNAGAGYNNVLVLDRGKVGIGTDSPNANGLTINKSGNHLFLSNTSTAAAIYWNFDVDSNNRLYIVTQPTATGVYISDGQTAWTGTSDESVKENIKPLEDVLEKIKDYRCVEYNLKIDKNKGKKIGFIAQDWENDFAPVIDKDKDGLLGMKYTETIPVLLKAIQELEARLKILENK